MDTRIEIFSFRLGEAPSTRQQELAYRQVLRGDPCSYCGSSPSRDADHIRPRWAIRGDWNGGWQNLTAACRRCNRRKGTRTALAFMVDQPIGRDIFSARAARAAARAA